MNLFKSYDEGPKFLSIFLFDLSQRRMMPLFQEQILCSNFWGKNQLSFVFKFFNFDDYIYRKLVKYFKFEFCVTSHHNFKYFWSQDFTWHFTSAHILNDLIITDHFIKPYKMWHKKAKKHLIPLNKNVKFWRLFKNLPFNWFKDSKISCLYLSENVQKQYTKINRLICSLGYFMFFYIKEIILCGNHCAKVNWKKRIKCWKNVTTKCSFLISIKMKLQK
jgi:hypothetical protein